MRKLDVGKVGIQMNEKVDVIDGEGQMRKTMMTIAGTISEGLMLICFKPLQCTDIEILFISSASSIHLVFDLASGSVMILSV